jgi:hypothetical protein
MIAAGLQYPAMSIDDAVNHARQRREELRQQEQEAVRRIGACLDEFLAELAAINDTKFRDPSGVAN